MAAVSVDEQSWKEVDRDYLSFDRTDKAFSLSIVQLNYRNVSPNQIFVGLGIEAGGNRPNLEAFARPDIDL